MAIEKIQRVSFNGEIRNEVQETVARAVEADPDKFIERFRALPQSLGGRFISADTFKETFEQYRESRESRNRLNGPVHNSAAVLASEQFRRVLQDEPESGRNEVILLTGSHGSGKTSLVLNKTRLPNKVHAIYEGQLADPEIAIAKVTQTLEAGFKPVIVVVHTTPERALDNALRRFDKIGRGASIGVIARIQGGLPYGLEAVRHKFGDSVELRVWDRRIFDKPALYCGWGHLPILKSEGNHEHIRQRLTRHLEFKRSTLTPDAYLQAAGIAPAVSGKHREHNGRNASIHDRIVNQSRSTGESRKTAGLTQSTELTFVDFAQSLGVYVDPQQLQIDGRVHRACVGDSPTGKLDASYLLHEDGTGWVTNFKTGGETVYYRPAESHRDLTPEEKARIKTNQDTLGRQWEEKRHGAVLESLTRWREYREALNFPYLDTPKLHPAGLRQGRAQLLVPVLALDDQDGVRWVGMQRIGWAESGKSADKRFVSGTLTKGAFAVIPIVGSDEEAPLRAFESVILAPQVVICEGIGTGLAIYQATGLPVIAALSAQNLPAVAQSLKTRLQGTVVICADNDGEKNAFKGQSYALKASKVFDEPAGIAIPVKPYGETPSGYDARDLLRDAGAESVLTTIKNLIEQACLEKLISPQSTVTTQAPEAKTTMENPMLNPAQVISFFDTLNKVREETDVKRDNRIVAELKQTVAQGVENIRELFEAHKRVETPKQQDQPQSPAPGEEPTNPESPAGKVEVQGSGSDSSGQPSSGVGREYKIDQDGIAADCALAQLDWNGAHALRLVANGRELTQGQVLLLRSGTQPDLIDEKSDLTNLGKLAYDRLANAKTARDLEQQQLRTRNIDQQMEENMTRKVHKVSSPHEADLGR
ncbi:MAG: hypothetical protein HO274_00475 [Ferrovum myxofaciens]|uniref:toprim domain-containing protein n=1 Tax=Ferrovum myxofaciens TaxID=416213 RepID=UPI002353576E|nr:toprim domain-containing protein [Ferrovum myxofaciens]QKE39975.1 MAG: hypothetical protein HO274_00475 [Ferrovum myxofaciens]